MGAGVNVVDAPLDAARDDIVPVLLEILVVEVGAQPTALAENAGNHLVHTFPVAAEADGADHPAGLAAEAVFHVRVVIEDLFRVLPLGIVGGKDVCRFDADGRPSGDGGGGVDELATRDAVMVSLFLHKAFSC